jgi:hypothetical protein
MYVAVGESVDERQNEKSALIVVYLFFKATYCPTRKRSSDVYALKSKVKQVENQVLVLLIHACHHETYYEYSTALFPSPLSAPALLALVWV